MSASRAKYTNDIVSLTVLALMVLALVAGQAGALPTPAHSANVDVLVETEQPVATDHDISRRHEGE